MLEIITLGSGSAGNATLIRSDSCAVLVDAGLSARQITSRLAGCGVTPADLAGILITHEHSDHTGALRVLLRTWRIPVFCNPLTARALKESQIEAEWRLFETGATFAAGDLAVTAFPVPHDAADPVGFRVASGTVSFGVLTDLGFATRVVFDMLRGIDGLLIETNHDEDLLQRDTKRPWSVKQRISSRHGHLSNAAAARAVAELDAPGLRQLVLGHMSRDCNNPGLAEGAMRGALGPARNPAIHCANQDAPSPPLSLT